jgi:GAF domain-containing protein
MHYLSLLETHLEVLAVWSHNSPINFANRYNLVRAEYCRLLGDQEEATQLYAKAIRLSRDNRFLHLEGLSCELYARFCLSLKNSNHVLVKGQFIEAKRCYTLWGGKERCKYIDTNFSYMLYTPNPGMLMAASHEDPELETIRAMNKDHKAPAQGNNNKSPVATASGELDLMVHVSQAFATESSIPVMLKKVFFHLLQYSGANKGLLIYHYENKLYVEAEGVLDSSQDIETQFSVLHSRLLQPQEYHRSPVMQQDFLSQPPQTPPSRSAPVRINPSSPQVSQYGASQQSAQSLPPASSLAASGGSASSNYSPTTPRPPVTLGNSGGPSSSSASAAGTANPSASMSSTNHLIAQAEIPGLKGIVPVGGIPGVFAIPSRAKMVPFNIINYVRSTKAVVRLNDLSVPSPDEEEERLRSTFLNDIYLATFQPRSILCMPITVRNDTTALLYLENNLAPQVFQYVHLLLLNNVASQIALSVEHHRLNQCLLKPRDIKENNLIKRGQLFKQTDSLLLKTWRIVWVVLTKRFMYIYPSANAKMPEEVINCQTASSAHPVTEVTTFLKPEYSYYFALETSERTHYFSARNDAKRQEWLTAISLIFQKEGPVYCRPEWQGTQENSVFLQLPKDVRIREEDITLEKRLGQGAASVVYRGRWHGLKVAVKILTAGEASAKEANEFYKEVALLRTLRHPNILQFLGAYMSERIHIKTHNRKQTEAAVKKDPPAGGGGGGGGAGGGTPGDGDGESDGPAALVPCIVVELMERGTLWQVLHNEELLLSGSRKYEMARQVAQGMAYLHNFEPPIIHRDLKSLNILVAQDFSLKIADFGLARVIPQSQVMTTRLGTVCWMAPEVFARSHYSEKADVYSYGIILWEIWTRKEPYTHIHFSGEIAHKVSIFFVFLLFYSVH